MSRKSSSGLRHKKMLSSSEKSEQGVDKKQKIIEHSKGYSDRTILGG